MLLSAVSVLVVAQSSSEIPEVLMNNPVHTFIFPDFLWGQKPFYRFLSVEIFTVCTQLRISLHAAYFDC